MNYKILMCFLILISIVSCSSKKKDTNQTAINVSNNLEKNDTFIENTNNEDAKQNNLVKVGIKYIEKYYQLGNDSIGYFLCFEGASIPFIRGMEDTLKMDYLNKILRADYESSIKKIKEEFGISGKIIDPDIVKRAFEAINSKDSYEEHNQWIMSNNFHDTPNPYSKNPIYTNSDWRVVYSYSHYVDYISNNLLIISFSIFEGCGPGEHNFWSTDYSIWIDLKKGEIIKRPYQVFDFEEFDIDYMNEEIRKEVKKSNYIGADGEDPDPEAIHIAKESLNDLNFTIKSDTLCLLEYFHYPYSWRTSRRHYLIRLPEIQNAGLKEEYLYLLEK